ncbi:MAG: formylmethanofuran dehydrogenase subunit B [Methanosphaera sp.]|uniref:formylmethanofuran dehydrogenase subunit B n=1 Tax=Methanosphaera sp. TaxID=2666342 RepID=UPI0025E56645|nr:formylmethanofuran dehydrogenase subunit B [Methanosphaera sp.]MCI5867538.1 formylmethanofuran dehydrogenase subunit B [Methanosphaera sp.]MDD6534005.1 formylmethanofuran dehydrogenase subunit B [Methanosphaera sp.]MDY3956185.1 formylmethanofuran dehydrogenase subunit B [Methanosphaera sp.]
MIQKPVEDYDEEIRNCSCSYCGNNCDDITYLLKDKKIVAVRHACRLGASKIINDEDQRLLNPMIRNEEGILKEVSWDEALNKAASLLKESVRPLFYGWGETSVEAIKCGIKVAQKTGAVMDNQSTICHGASIQAFQNIGHPVMTLGEVKNRSDVIIYFGTNPMDDHPRHLSRYSAFPKGFFRENGRDDRTIITIDPKYTNTAKVSDRVISYAMGEDYAFLNALRVAIQSKEIKSEEIAGIKREEIYELAEIMKNAENGALFFGLGLTQSEMKRNIDILIQIVEDLNAYSKWSMLPMRGFFNVNGFNIAMTTETGYPYGVDFARGYPRYMIGETTTIDLLNRREVDFFAAIAADPVIQFPGHSIKHLANIPTVQIDTHWGPYTEIADVVLPSTRVGVETAGTGYRMDSVPIYMKKVIEKPENCHSDEWILTKLYEKLQQDEDGN